ncbi:MAG: sulfate ABC transporter substrate-binding protein [Solirubrobacterales bacterium]|nr:sulfate ABC transporter substrate-binding protein [Solirubrobacterales bacterium]
MSRTLKIIISSIVAFVAAVSVAGCGGGSDAGTKLALVAYSTPQEAYKKLIPAFQATTAGTDVDFSESYGASGEQSRAVANGLPADVVEFSHVGDMERLVEKGTVAKDWDTGEYRGIVSDSVVVFAVRKGNPKKIKNWSDLTRPGVEVITANAVVSGGARWNLIAAYGQAIKSGASQRDALGYVSDLLKNVPVQDKSAREALQTFSGGKGDVLLTYENEAITAKNAGQDVDYVIPPTTILIENPVAATAKAPKQAQAFVDYLFTDEAQKIFAEAGYRPVNQALLDETKFPQPDTLLNVDEFGGWSQISDFLFDEKTGKVTEINESLGVENSD